MKSRFLLLRFFVLLLGFSTFNLSTLLYAGNPDGNKAAADRMQQIRSNQNTGEVSAADMMRAEAQVNAMAKEKSMTDANLNWKQVGPNNAAGRTRTVLFSNKDASGMTILTGGVAGGIWKSRNLGLTWHQMNTQDNEVLRVTSMVQSTGGTIYVATGESYCNFNQYIGTGIYRSDDDSVFTLLPNTKPIPNNPSNDWAFIANLALSPSGRIFAATNTGLKYSDNGTDWLVAKSGYAYNVTIGLDGTIITNIDNLAYIAVAGDINNFVNLSTNTPTTFPSTGVNGMAFAFAPSDGNVIYASLANLSGNLLNVYKSTDKGTTWSVVFPGNGTFEPLGGSGCYSNCLAVLPNNPDQVLLGGSNLWRGKKYQETGYYSWEMVSFGGIVEESYTINNPLILPMGKYMVPLFDHQVLFRPNMETQFAVATDDGISVGTINSTDITYQHLIKNLNISQFSSVAFNMKKVSAIGGASYIGAEYIPGGNTLNEPQNGEQMYPGYGGNVAWSLIHPSTVFFGTGTTSGQPFARSEDYGATRSPTFLGLLTNSHTAAVALWEDFNFEQSVDSLTFKNISAKIKKDSIFNVFSANGGFPIHFQAPYDIDSMASIRVKDVVQARFFISGIISGSGAGSNKAGIFMSKQALQFGLDPQWFRIANINPVDVVTCFAVSKDLSTLWAGTSKGKLYRLTNVNLANDSATAMVDSAGYVIDTVSFDSTVYVQFKNRYITSISIGQDNQSVLITLGNYGNSSYVYKTTNGLDALPVFTDVQGNLPFMPVYSGLYELSNKHTVVIGTEYGVFSTPDITVASPIWSQQVTGSGNAPVTMITQQTNEGLYYYRPENYGDLYISTFGRGIFYDDSYEVILGTDPINAKPVAENRLKVQPNPFTGQVNISYKTGKTATVSAMVYDLSGRTIYSVSFGSQQPGEHTQVLNLQSIPSGTYIIKVDTGSGSLFGKAMKVN
jgi:hypothetical protein